MVDATHVTVHWFVAALLLLLLLASLTGPGIWMGVGLLWMLLAPAALLGLAVYLAVLASRRAPSSPDAPAHP